MGIRLSGTVVSFQNELVQIKYSEPLELFQSSIHIVPLVYLVQVVILSYFFRFVPSVRKWKNYSFSESVMTTLLYWNSLKINGVSYTFNFRYDYENIIGKFFHFNWASDVVLFFQIELVQGNYSANYSNLLFPHIIPSVLLLFLIVGGVITHYQKLTNRLELSQKKENSLRHREIAEKHCS